ncbi:MAG TPA: carboxypeptidase regulatory-like domain-containing protein [Polyangia bacterium]|nr:carboxypeptidase regulatory-like domain-containing protein [Polyangia bacterium]
MSKPGSGGSAGATSGSGGNAGASMTGTGGSLLPPPSATPCKGLECARTTCNNGPCTQQPCGAGQQTSVSGMVFDPAGKVPLYNIVVYVPNLPLVPLKPIVEGVTCDKCQTTIDGAVAAALTDSAGNFKLNDVPVGTDIPLVIEVGKWRRQITIPSVARCTNTAMTDKNLTRLPKNKAEGHIPKIALTTGGVDALECLLRKIGIEDSEFTPEAMDGRVNLFAGGNAMGVPMSMTSPGTASYDTTLNGGAKFTDAEVWWESLDNLKKYDLVLHSCEGTQDPTNKSAVATAALQSYADVGGRVFASHWHNYWIRSGPAPLSTIGMFGGNGNLNMITATIDTSFPKGNALADWLVAVGASTMRGQLPIVGGKRTMQTLNTMVAQRWIYLDMPETIQYLTANTPVGAAADAQCGRVVFSDLHVSSGLGRATDDKSNPLVPFPTGCMNADLSPQEKALEFMLFDLSSCIRRDDVPPVVK